MSLLARQGVEKLAPLFSTEVELEMTEWTQTTRGERNLPWHALAQASVEQHRTTLYVAERQPGRLLSSTS